MTNLKEHIKGTATFIRYSKGELWYKTEAGLEFAVPVSDTGDGSFMANDKAMLFMRWIRKQLELNAQGLQG